MKLHTLYILTEKDQIQEWTIAVRNNTYFTCEGITNGKITQSSPTVCKGKNTGKANGTTDAEQAQKEAEAKWKKKKEKGYCESIEQAKKGISAFFEPMLAHSYDDYKEELWDNVLIYSQPKLDGIRCIVTKDGMFSRNGKTFVSAPHIRQALNEFFKRQPDAVLDGELYCNKFNNDFNKICSLVKKTKPTAEDLAESARTLEYWVYDAPCIDSLNETQLFSDRTLAITEQLKGLNKIVIVPTGWVKSARELDTLYEEYVSDGYEGQMIRINAPYHNKRTKFLLKRKEFKDSEYKIIDIGEGEGNRAGGAGYMLLENTDGSTFRSNIKGNFDYLKAVLKDRKQLIGQLATVKYFNLTPDNVPRFPFVTSIRNYE